MKIGKLFHTTIPRQRWVDSKAMKADRYIVWVCLGAQLLSVAYGAKYEHSPEREIGVYPVTWHRWSNRSACPLVGRNYWNWSLAWRYAGIDRGCCRSFATSQGCPCQIIRFSSKHHAFQAHLEFDPEAVDLLIAADGEDLWKNKVKTGPLFKTWSHSCYSIIEKWMPNSMHFWFINKKKKWKEGLVRVWNWTRNRHDFQNQIIMNLPKSCVKRSIDGSPVFAASIPLFSPRASWAWYLRKVEHVFWFEHERKLFQLLNKKERRWVNHISELNTGGELWKINSV